MDRISTHRDSEGGWETLARLVYPLSTGFIFPSPQMQKQTLSQRECFTFRHLDITRGARVPLNLNLKQVLWVTALTCFLFFLSVFVS